MTEQIFTGVIADPRGELAKGSDWTHEELFGTGNYQWQEKPLASWPTYPTRNQNGSGECGAFSGAFALGRNEEKEHGKFVLLDPDYIYSLRANAGTGMWLENLLSIMCKYGSPTDPNMLSDNHDDVAAAKRTYTQEQKDEALKYRGSSYVLLDPANLDSLAQAIDLGNTPILLMRCSMEEWTAEPKVIPTVTQADWNINHFIPSYLATLYNGVKSFVVNDSWGWSGGRNGRRILSADFMSKRVFAAGYVLDLVIFPTSRPVHKFTKILEYGSSGAEVTAWQKILQYEKLLPTHTSTGVPLPFGQFLEMTAKATKQWQINHGIMDFANENDVKKIRMGKKTIDAANKLYSS